MYLNTQFDKLSCQQELLKKCSWEWEGSICAVHQKSELWCSCWGVDPGGRFAQQKKLFRVFWKAISEVRKKQDLLQYNMNNLFKRSSMSVCVQSRNCVTPSNRTPLVSFNLVLVSSNNNTVHGNWKLSGPFLSSSRVTTTTTIDKQRRFLHPSTCKI